MEASVGRMQGLDRDPFEPNPRASDSLLDMETPPDWLTGARGLSSALLSAKIVPNHDSTPWLLVVVVMARKELWATSRGAAVKQPWDPITSARQPK